MNKKLILLFLFFPAILCAQHYITGTFSPAPDYKFVILYRVTPTGAQYTVDGPVDKNGNFKVEMDSKVTIGTYIVTYGIPQGTHNFDVVYNGKEDITLNFDTENGVQFTSSGQNKLLSEYLVAMQNVQTEITLELNSKNAEDTKIEQLLKKQAQIQANAEKASAGTYVSTFIKANKPFIPTNFENSETYSEKRKDNYFKNFDFNSLQLQSSSFPLNKITSYYDEFTSKNNSASIEKSIDCIDEQLNDTDADFHKALLTNFWTSLITENNTDAANYLADEYIIPLAKKDGDQKLIQQLTMFKNVSLGAKAPDFSWSDTKNGASKTLYGLQGASNYIVAFWSAECSHCDIEIPKLYKKIDGLSKGEVKVVAVGLEDTPDLWEKKILNYPKFENVLGLKKWDNKIAGDYGVMGTPTFFVLDKDKKILAKPEGLEELFKTIGSFNK